MRGSIVKRSEGSWTIVLDLGRDPATGKRRQQWVSVKGTKKEAEKRLAELIHQADTGSLVMPGKLTLGDFLARWLRDYGATNVRPTTLDGYEGRVHRYIVPCLGAIGLTALKPAHLQAFYGQLLTKGAPSSRGPVSAQTVRMVHRLLHEALSHAVKWGLTGRNVAEAVDPPRPSERETQALDAADVHKLLEAAQSTRWHHLLHLSIHSGLRRSELLGLRWKDIDLDMATLSVVQTLHHLQDGRYIFEPPKTAKGKRMIALSPTATLALRAYRERQEADRMLLERPLGDSDLVFSEVDGSPIRPDTLTRAFVTIAHKAGITGLRLHDLRHTHASLMLKAGIHPKVVSERLGHANIAITLDTYSHVLPGLQEAAAQRFDEVLAR